MKTNVKFQIEIETPTKREIQLRQSLSELPESNPENLMRDMENSFDRLFAAEQLVKDCEQNLKIHMWNLRNAVARQWKESEISEDVKAVLNVW